MRTGQDNREPLAIVGIGCRLPGGADSPEKYWSLLCSGTDATRVVPETRWNAAKYHDPNPEKVGKMVTRRGGFLDRIDQFDAQFFGISPREANLLDPQQRLLLMTTWEALEDGGIPADGLAGTNVGVFIGGFTLDYQLLQNQGRTSRFLFKTHSATGMMMTMLANRISFAFDFHGPSMTVDTACSSSLVAVHLAAQSIWDGECDLALAGGVNIMVGPNTAIAESKSGFLSPDGRCKAFDASADGYARGEGGAVVVIKPLQQALHDGDEVYAQILGTAVSQDGHTDSITVPSEEAQQAAICAALRRAGVQPDEIGYVEAHGTGTPVGDPVELRALAGVLARDRPATNPLLIGSVKTNIGHLEAGAGVAGLIKTALVLKHGHIPAHLHLEKPGSEISFEDLRIDVPRTGRPFPGDGRRLAGVNSFGFGGTNAHVVLLEPPQTTGVRFPDRPQQPPLTVLPVSARSSDALTATARQLAEHLSTQSDVTLSDLGYTLGRRRSHLNHRRAVIVRTLEEARDEFQALADGVRIATTRADVTAPKLAFVCTGMGPQWWKMCRGLLDVYPAFTESILRSDRALSRYTGWSLLDELRSDEAGSRMSETDVAQPANFAIQIALAEQLAQFGIKPDAVVGHSAGEVASHYLAGLLSFEQAIEVIYHRSRLQQRTSGMGRMLAVGLGVGPLQQTLDDESLDEIGRRISIAAINSPSAVTLAGDGDVLEDLAHRLDDIKVFNRFLTGKVPYHTHYMDTVKDDLYQALQHVSSDVATVPLYSTVTGERLDQYAAGAAYWWQNTRATVLFEAAARRMLDDGYTHFVELGPHPVLAPSIIEIAGTEETDVVVLPSQRRDDDDDRVLMNCVGALYCHGHAVAWEALQPSDGARLLKLPTYPWQSKRFWNETQEAAEDLHYRPVHPLLGQAVRAVHPTWEAELSTAVAPFLADHQVHGSIVVPAAVFVEIALAAAQQTYGSFDHTVDNLVLRRALILDGTCDPILRTTLNQDTGALEFAAFTATSDGDVGWTITATAELNTLTRPRSRRDAPNGTDLTTTISGEEFYARTQTIGFQYGETFQSVRGITAAEGCATAELAVPALIADELDGYRFHPALIDGAFQTLFGANLLGPETAESPYLPTRIRQSAILGLPQAKMTAQVRVASATDEEIESDITITGDNGELLAVFTGFTVQSLRASSRMSSERIDKGLYELHWVSSPEDGQDQLPGEPATDRLSWLVFVDTSGVGTALVEQLHRRGQYVQAVVHQPVETLAETDCGYALNPRRPEQLHQLLDACLEKGGDLAGIINCWPMDIAPDADSQHDHVGIFTILHLVKAFAERTTVRPRLYLVTSNGQPALGAEAIAVEQAAIWGLGRVIGHQEFIGHWGGLIDTDGADDRTETAAHICEHVLGNKTEDQIAIRGATTLVPRLRPCSSLAKSFPTKLTADATYVVTGGAGALGRSVATYLAERGARHIALLGRSSIPPRDQWPSIGSDNTQYAIVQTIRKIERIGAQVVTASVDITDAHQVQSWLDDYTRQGGREVRGIVHAAGSVHDQLLVNISEADFAKVLAPKITGTRVLHNAFQHHDLEFFVMFGSAGSVVASPGQGNYAAANAFMDAFAHYRRAQGLPALTIGWGPWSVGMVEELKLEKVYAQRGIELITPAAGVRILDRLINQKAPNVIAISADWRLARSIGFSAGLPQMFAELGTADTASPSSDAELSVLELIFGLSEADRLDVVTARLGQLVAGVFDLDVSDIEFDDILSDIGLDSMMAMDFRLRINRMFGIDLPVLEILRGVSVTSLADRILAELPLPVAEPTPMAERGVEPDAPEDDINGLIGQLSEAELRELLVELESPPAEQERGETL
ncbi:polyketide synthase [Mycobacterium asiaticum]|uniref:Polyketide synthase n=1 Tax=Mycobacterium asiaticum TaxID=1790 RepID=A0A1A3NP66_MYCAS|nr:type I polyketide synthase [Mycobacterium asiaticum]OBK23641.1 polyketide synthase [Mycobacterium asiaticum]